MKTSMINVRVGLVVKEDLEDIGNESNKPISEVVRDAIDFYVKNRDNFNPSIIEEDSMLIIPNEHVDEDFLLLKSWGVTRLIHWVMLKKYEPYIDGEIQLYNQFMELILKMENNRYFPEDIMIEFKKVYFELYKYNIDPVFKRSYRFRFADSFDYAKFNRFMQYMRYNEDGVLTIYIQ